MTTTPRPSQPPPADRQFHFQFYYDYLCQWPGLCYVSKDPSGRVEGYSFSKIEGEHEKYHGHLTAISVAREFRKTGVSHCLMAWLRDICEAFSRLPL